MGYVKKYRKVSIAMAIYNCASTLREAIDSIVNQTYTDWELILCDDCSTDDTLDVAKEYEQKYDNILVIENSKNLGLPASLNHCIEYAQGDYIARMDGDDISLPTRFEKEMAVFESHPDYAIVSCAMEHFDENGVFRVFRQVENPTKKCFIGTTPHCHAPAIIRKDALIKVDCYTVKRWTKRGQDVHLWAKMYNAGFKGYNIQEPLYSMRDDEAAYKRRTLKESFIEVRRNYEIFKLVKIPFWSIKGVYGLVRPVLVSLLPPIIYKKLHKMKK